MSIKTIVLLALITTSTAYCTFSIMLDPAGDAKQPGRQIEDNLERGISLKCAQELKKQIEQKYDDVRVILTRFPGETIQPLQNAQFSNRLNVDFYLSIHFYPEKETKPSFFVYYFSLADDFITKVPDLFFCPYDQAHRINMTKTQTYAQNIANSLKHDDFKNLFSLIGPRGIPFKPLIGIKSPAVAVEIGLHHKDDWKRYIQPLLNSLDSIFFEKQV